MQTRECTHVPALHRYINSVIISPQKISGRRTPSDVNEKQITSLTAFTFFSRSSQRLSSQADLSIFTCSAMAGTLALLQLHRSTWSTQAFYYLAVWVAWKITFIFKLLRSHFFHEKCLLSFVVYWRRIAWQKLQAINCAVTVALLYFFGWISTNASSSVVILKWEM